MHVTGESGMFNVIMANLVNTTYSYFAAGLKARKLPAFGQ